MERIQEVLAKVTWNEEDIKLLMDNVKSLPRTALERLGLAPVTPTVAVKEPVIEPLPITGEAKAAAKIRAEQEQPAPVAPAKKSRKSNK